MKNERNLSALGIIAQIPKIWLMLFFALPLLAAGQNGTAKISGKLTVAGTHLPVAAATVTNLTQKKSVLSQMDGSYAIEANVADRIRVTSVNYKPQAFAVSSDSTVYNIALEEDANDLKSVVVVGYGTVRKEDVTGSVAQVNMSDLLKAPVKSFDEALAGRVAGVQVTSSDGQPGAGINIIVRGANSVTQSNSPLYVIDGFPIEDPDNNAINPDDIESINVLKDASATAIYGARGANGVIMITTKRGKTGAPVVSLKTDYGVQKISKKIEMMQPADFVQYMLDWNPSTTPWDPSTGLSSITPYQLYLSGNTTMDYYKDTAAFIDWQGNALRTAPMQTNTLNVSGGSGGTRYSVSGNIVNQDGIILNSGYKRYQGRASLDQQINKKIKFGVNFNYSRMEQYGIIVAESSNSATTNLMYSIWGYRPVEASPASQAATGVNDNYSQLDALVDPTVASTQDYRFNPVVDLKNSYNHRYTNNLVANTYLEYKILPALTLRVTGGINDRLVRQEKFNNAKTHYGNPFTSSNGPNGSVIFYKNTSLLNENYLTYNKVFNKVHALNIMAGFSEQKNTSSSYGSSAIEVPNEELGINALSQGTPISITSVSSLNTSASFISRINYGYASKYLVTATFRRDGSSKFSAENHWGNFPSGAFAWNFQKENFLKGFKALSEGKLRITYGATGNNRVSDFAYLSNYSQTPGNNTVYTFNNVPVTGAVPTTIGNKNLKWETTYQWDGGLDLAFFKNRISFTGDVYSKKTKNLLLNASVPTSTGYTSVYENIGDIRNTGLELALNTVNIQTPKFSWTSSFNIAFNKSKVLALANNEESLLSSIAWDNNWSSVPAYISKIGQPLGMMYGYIWDGVYQYSDFDNPSPGVYSLKSTVPTNGNARANIQPGDIKYKDINGDGVVNANDYTIIGHSLPVHTGGFANNFTYGNFDLSIFLQWSYGNDIMNANRMVFEGNALAKNFLEQYASYDNYWTPENTNTDQFRVKGYYGGGYSSKTVEDGSYLRLKTVSFGYNLPQSLLTRLKLKKIYLYASGQNLITWTKYSGTDPEVNTYSSSVLTGGFDYSPYPRAKTFVFGLNVVF